MHLWVLPFLLHIALATEPKEHHQQCKLITNEMCSDLPYNTTSFPNLAGHADSELADEALKQFKPLIIIKCSEELKFLLCSVYFPMCDERISAPIGPCRPLCESVRDKCLPLMKGYGFAWPEAMNCTKFYDKLCVRSPND